MARKQLICGRWRAKAGRGEEVKQGGEGKREARERGHWAVAHQPLVIDMRRRSSERIRFKRTHRLAHDSSERIGPGKT
eukprot:364917-Chlamydomonas_euryale.AAC.1